MFLRFKYPQMKGLGDALIENGIVILPEFFSDIFLQLMQYEFSEACQGVGPDPDGFDEVRPPRETLTHSAILSVVAKDFKLRRLASYYWGKPVKLAQSAGFRLEPTEPKEYRSFQWHHDNKGKQIKVFILLSDVPPEGQAMKYIPGTHRLKHKPSCYEETRFKWDEIKHHGDPVVCSGKAGTVIIFDTNGLHSGTRNMGPRRDCWVFHYTAGHAMFPVPPLHPLLFDGGP